MPPNTEEIQVLEKLEMKIADLLKKKKMRPDHRALLEILDLFVIYLQEDHRKVRIMWSVFQPMAWVSLIFATCVIGLIASGRVSIIVK